ncbi:MAG: hypothetical protein COV76_05065 [Candidatus Omnitrophica bacterium CG11_big_fil_rev_8_21_14_0_20_64_10]|nr:MAG: hypothetical protein COV76_05065 [Candidatus Omnitrophica bacterium CG11_big_fil_rev_8_21_14_0_20_64_10]
MMIKRSGLLLLAMIGLLAGPTAAEQVEYVGYRPAAGAGSSPTTVFDRIHADRGTIGPAYGNVADGAILDGMMFVQERLGVGMPVIGGQLAQPGVRLQVFGEDQLDAPALAVDRGAVGEDFQGILMWVEDRDAFVRYEEDASEGAPGRLHLQTALAGGLVNDTLVLTDLGQAGIGTIPEAGVLHVESGDGNLPTAVEEAQLIVQRNAQTADEAGIWLISGSNGIGTVRFAERGAADSGEIRYDDAADRLQLALDGNPILSVNPQGQVGIGTTNPEASLQVAGGVYFLGGNGDVNGDGAFSAIDVLNIINANNGGTVGNLDPGAYARADVSGDGRVNGTDVLLMIAMSNGEVTLDQARALGKGIEGQALGVDLLGNVIIGGVPNPADQFASAKLAFHTGSSGFAPPQLTTDLRDAIVNPEGGLMIYNLTTHQLEYFNGVSGAWEPLGGGSGISPAYDSDWLVWADQEAIPREVVFTHNLGTTDTVVSVESIIEQRDSPAGCANLPDRFVYSDGLNHHYSTVYYNKTAQQITVRSNRGSHIYTDAVGCTRESWHRSVRIRMWRMD